MNQHDKCYDSFPLKLEAHSKRVVNVLMNKLIDKLLNLYCMVEAQWSKVLFMSANSHIQLEALFSIFSAHLFISYPKKLPP